MLASGGRSGISYKAHRDACENQGLRHCFDRFGVSGLDFCALLLHGLQGRLHHVHHFLAVILAVDQVGEFPVKKACILAERVAKSCGNQLHRRGTQDIRIANDCDRSLAIQCSLYMVQHQGRAD